jgi:hypothetical protein
MCHGDGSHALAEVVHSEVDQASYPDEMHIIRSREHLLGANAQGLSPTNCCTGTCPYSASCERWLPLLSIHYRFVTLGPIANGNPGLEHTRTLCGFIL